MARVLRHLTDMCLFVQQVMPDLAINVIGQAVQNERLSLDLAPLPRSGLRRPRAHS